MFICLQQFSMLLFLFQHNFFHEKYLSRNMNHKKIRNRLGVRDIIKHQIHFLKIIQEREQTNAKMFLFLFHLQIYIELNDSHLPVFYLHPIKTINHLQIFPHQLLDLISLHLKQPLYFNISLLQLQFFQLTIQKSSMQYQMGMFQSLFLPLPLHQAQ